MDGLGSGVIYLLVKLTLAPLKPNTNKPTTTDNSFLLGSSRSLHVCTCAGVHVVNMTTCLQVLGSVPPCQHECDQRLTFLESLPPALCPRVHQRAESPQQPWAVDKLSSTSQKGKLRWAVSQRAVCVQDAHVSETLSCAPTPGRREISSLQGHMAEKTTHASCP